MKRNNVIQYKGKTIYYMDFSNLKSTQEISELINDSKIYIRNQPPSSVLTMSNVTDMHFNSEIRDVFSSFVKGNKPYVKAGAVVGISGLQSVVYNAITKLTGRSLKSIGSIDAAKEWLVMNS